MLTGALDEILNSPEGELPTSRGSCSEGNERAEAPEVRGDSLGEHAPDESFRLPSELTTEDSYPEVVGPGWEAAQQP